MEFDNSEIFNMVTAININWGEFTVEGIFHDDEKAKMFADQLIESTDYVNESVSIEKLQLSTIVDIMVNDRLTGISKTLSARILTYPK